MVTKKQLQNRIEYLERELYELKTDRLNDHKMFTEIFDERYKDVRTLVEKYVQEHIWYTTQDNLKAFQTGEKVKVILRDLNETLEGGDAK